MFGLQLIMNLISYAILNRKGMFTLGCTNIVHSRNVCKNTNFAHSNFAKTHSREGGGGREALSIVFMNHVS
jgi:hypothetical protein